MLFIEIDGYIVNVEHIAVIQPFGANGVALTLSAEMVVDPEEGITATEISFEDVTPDDVKATLGRSVSRVTILPVRPRRPHE
jgi:hypothetical protein